MPFEQGSEYKGPLLPRYGKQKVVRYSRALDDRRPNLLTSVKWCASVLLAIFVCLQITRGVDVTDWTVKTVTVFPDLYEASVLELQRGLDAGHFSSVDLVKVLTNYYYYYYWLNSFILLYLNLNQTYFARIEEVNLQGPKLRAVLELNPSALIQAAALDKERKLAGKRSHLHGIPVLLKVCFFYNQFQVAINKQLLQDNIATIASEGEHTGHHSFLFNSSFNLFSGMNTTAGSFSLLGSVVPEDAGVVKRLRAAGAIILGKL
jgi:amidase